MPERRRPREEGVPPPARSRDLAGDTAERPKRRPRGLSAASAGEFGLQHIADLTGRETEGVTRVKPEEDGWLVNVEVVEDRRIPSSGDILALYEAELDPEGDLLSYRRLRRYRRGSGDYAEESR
ncbi:gas vesicle protein GvpO [Nonomuraea angiospora]|uniref:gas vesicle protein GvpO n=1 Tax=Nonomuraea angiospora TaxID=46172 RepID=UPI0029AEE7EA|nr:gas vesicle protein GvpO [Nonomuraea angiospora]MDX3102674.1 gas vesicle protein [Nonomuraea angiospora]